MARIDLETSFVAPEIVTPDQLWDVED